MRLSFRKNLAKGSGMLVAKKNPDKNLDQEMKSSADQVGLKASAFRALAFLRRKSAERSSHGRLAAAR